MRGLHAGGAGRARACRPSGRAAQEHAERLAQRHVAHVRQRRDHQPLLDACAAQQQPVASRLMLTEVEAEQRCVLCAVHASAGLPPSPFSQQCRRTQVLERVLKVDVADGDDDRVALLAPIEAALLQPLKVGRVADLLLHQLLCASPARCSCKAVLSERARHMALQDGAGSSTRLGAVVLRVRIEMGLALRAALLCGEGCVPLDSFWCMWTVMQVSRLMRWMRVRSWRSVMATISRSSASALRAARVTAPLSVLAVASATCARRRRGEPAKGVRGAPGRDRRAGIAVGGVFEGHASP